MKFNAWDRRFLLLAEHVASWSKDPSTQCGAVIAKENRIVSLGFNGFARGVKDTEDRLSNRHIKLSLVLHAEENALLFAGKKANGATAYVWPFPPCSLCAARLIQCGIRRVVAPVGTKEQMVRWKQSWDLAKLEYQDAKVQFDLIDFDYKFFL